MNHINRLIVTGVLVTDKNNSPIEVRYGSSGTAFANVRVRCIGEYQGRETSTTISVVLFGDLAEAAAEISPGELVTGEGKLSNRKYQDKAGNDRWVTEVIMYKFGRAEAEKQPEPKAAPKPAKKMLEFDDDDNDIF